MGADDLHRGLHLPKPGLPRSGFVSSRPLSLWAVTHSPCSIPIPEPGPCGEPILVSREGRQSVPLQLAMRTPHKFSTASGPECPSQMRRQGPLTCSRNLENRWTTMTGMASEGRMRYDSHKISDDLGQPSCRMLRTIRWRLTGSVSTPPRRVEDGLDCLRACTVGE